jgi:phosphoserine phosphatase
VSAKYRFIFFDVDSTLVTIEGIDILGRGNEEVARLTEKAMNGEIPLEEVYARRLEMIRPSQKDLEALAAQYVDSLVDGARETISRLRDAGAIVQLVSAGVEQAILPLARELGVGAVHAVRLRFKDGAYDGFEPSFLTRTGGKELVIRDIRARTKGKAAMIGDGASDLEAKPAVDLFIGFGGVHIRPRVRDNADVFVTDLPAVIPHLIA